MTDFKVSVQQYLTTSNNVTSTGDVTGMTYGGVSDGTVAPETKHYNVWDEDWNK